MKYAYNIYLRIPERFEKIIAKQLKRGGFAMEELKRAIIAHLGLLTAEELRLIYRLIRLLARK